MSTSRREQVLLLLADGFDEAVVGTLLAAFRRAGLAVVLVGLRTREIRGAHGLVIMPNMGLDGILAAIPPLAAMILPGEAVYCARLRRDPRVEILFREIMAQKLLWLASSDQAEQLIHELTRPECVATQACLRERGDCLETIAETIARQLCQGFWKRRGDPY